MLCRFVVKNVLSFGEEREFDMFPSGKQRNHAHHKYTKNGVELLKMAAIYGANGAGKSNLIKAVMFLKEMIKEGTVSNELFENRNKFLSKEEPQLLGIEFIKENTYFSYAIEVKNGTIFSEELYTIKSNGSVNELIFKRTNSSDKLEIEVNDNIKEDEESALFIKLLRNKALGKNELLLTKVQSLGFESIKEINWALDWLNNDLIIIHPYNFVEDLTFTLLVREEFSVFASEYLKSINVGITDINFSIVPIDDFFGTNEIDVSNKIKEEMLFEELDYKSIKDKRGNEVLITKSGGNFEAVTLELIHKGYGNEVPFNVKMESDGTQRLMDIIPLLFEATKSRVTYVVDELERSIHPSLIHQLLTKFSKNEKTKGQIILTTHETCLLDQDILRRDEIWFAEKDKNGSTDLYPLSDFKEHHTKNIRNGYLNGRYGGIPFLGDLEKLNWSQNAVTK